MPANLTPIYYSAEEKYKQAKDDHERLKALREMLAVIPKHKGTDKLQGDIKRKIARLKEEQQTKKTKGPKRFAYHVDKEGAGQVAVVGPTNVGKTQLVNALTNATFEVENYPFTTRLFQPAMMLYEDIQIQLVDFPPLSREHLENWVPSLIKNSDALLLVFDFSRDDLLDQVETSLELLQYHKIEIEDIKTTKEDFRWCCMKSVIVANKMDISKSKNNLSIFKEFYGNRFPIFTTSAKDKTSIEELILKIVKLLNIVRVYSKRPGYDPEYNNPFILSRGKTLLDFAKIVHHDFAKNLKYARVWGKNKFEGQRITKRYTLEDKDVIELHR